MLSTIIHNIIATYKHIITKITYPHYRRRGEAFSSCLLAHAALTIE